MKAVPSTFYEINEQTQQEENTPRGFAGATIGSGIEPNVHGFPSPSMTVTSGAVAMSIIGLYDKEEPTELPAYKLVWLSPDLENIEYRGLYTIRQIPEDIRQQLRSLRQQETEKDSYDIADSITEWITEASGTEQAALVPELRELRPKDIRVLLSSLADSEVRFRSERLLHAIAGLLDTDDKRLAQASALCLLQCGGVLGGTLLRFRLANPASLPHIDLILGAINLLTSR